MTREEAWKKWHEWFGSQSWTPLPFQQDAWKAMDEDASGLVSVPTGAGKTYAVFGGALVDAMSSPGDGLKVLYVTPLRALSRSIENALRLPTEAISSLTVGSRTGDTSSYQRSKQKKKMPHVLVTTPESLSLLLSFPTAHEDFAKVRTIIVDEWHELLSTKRGSLLELALARVKTFSRPKIWALSATLANLEQAAQAAVGAGSNPRLITSTMKREVILDSLLPTTVEKFPWAGHLGIRMLPAVLEKLSDGIPTLLFTNTRSQSERWYQAILDAKPEWKESMGLHHGSLDRTERERVETGLQSGAIRLAVCTSSLDLGVDLPPVQRVVQIGSPKGIARLIQRAGRATHIPGQPCHILFVPTHAFELVEIAAARDAIDSHRVEKRSPLSRPLDVLSQHLVSTAVGGGFTPGNMFREIQTAYGFRDLTWEEFRWALLFITKGGVLHAYPEYKKVVLRGGKFVGAEETVARRHRQNIGTITSDSTLVVKFMKGKTLGSVEETYLARLRKGENFMFAGKLLHLVMIRDMVAYVRLASGGPAGTPRWYGGRLPMSSSLSAAVRERLEKISREKWKTPEIQAIAPVLETQIRLSQIPRADECLVEMCGTRDGQHLFLFPFEGRLVHEGLAALLASRMGQIERTTFSLAVNDYGIEFLAPKNYPFLDVFSASLFSTERLAEEMEHAVNLSELARRQFREIARVSGLVFQSFRGANKTARQLQASASLLYDVFQRYDPQNLLLQQSRREVLDQQFEKMRLIQTLERLQKTKLTIRETEHPTPLAFPLVAERLGARLLSTLTLEERIHKMTAKWEKESPYPSKAKPWTYFPKEASTGEKRKRSF